MNENDDTQVNLPKVIEVVLQTPHALLKVTGDLIVRGKHDAALPTANQVAQILFDAERAINERVHYLRAHINLREIE